ncbi:expansin [Marchantia polymorpha subsp. ruderalis]|nr:hypothetical protein MARPO_0178s0009 [Marchantia polymorpha]BBN06860.1 hypothetical protein Mp_3g24450 [Marchantia polymorpha subsp. ruderalis]|eukprot:PTQ27956.1 hypothetical protein MARPO_0178s0009 [Marchantia polymorpha]
MVRDLLSFNVLLILIFASTSVNAGPVYANTEWTDSHATFNDGNNAQGTMGGACGYGNISSRGYGLETTALSSTLFNSGLTCGACFEIKCKVENSTWCFPNAGSIKVTATDLCPANPAMPTNNGGWCNPPRTHFDLSYQMFTRLAKAEGAIIPVQFRRVPCVKVGGIRFTMNGNPWFNLVLVSNVAGAGNVVNLQMKSSETNWFWMTARQISGQYWELNQNLMGQNISFRVTLGNGKVMIANNVVPANWNFQQTFESDINF